MKKIVWLISFLAITVFISACSLKNDSTTDFIKVKLPRQNALINSPLKISGEARGYWFFEGDFPIILKTETNEIIAKGTASARGDWMTEDFVPFIAELRFDTPNASEGILVFEMDNPSGLAENDMSKEVTVKF